MSTPLFWYNGKLVQSHTIELAIDDPGLLYGAMVFTTLRVYHQSLSHPLTNWNAHCGRLKNSLGVFGWPLPDWERVREGAEALIPSFPVLRIVIFPDGREWISGRDLPPDLAARQNQGITAWVADTPECRRSLPNHKTGNYLGGWLSLQQAQRRGAQEAILIDEKGNWLETSTGNLWGWAENTWWTPPLASGILPGVVRSQLIQFLTQQGLTVPETPWHTQQVKAFEAIAYSNSVMEIIPIHTIVHSTESLTYPLLTEPLYQLRRLFTSKT